MKNTVLIFLTLITLCCKAQTIVPLTSQATDDTPNAYYKDLGNDLNKFIGTWIYQNGSTIFTVVFEKSIKMYMLDGEYSDVISGWYKYVENGVPKVNTLLMTANKELIFGSSLSDDKNRLVLIFSDPGRPAVSSNLFIDYIESTGFGNPPKIEWNLYQTGVSHVMEGEPAPSTDFRVPLHSILIKQ